MSAHCCTVPSTFSNVSDLSDGGSAWWTRGVHDFFISGFQPEKNVLNKNVAHRLLMRTQYMRCACWLGIQFEIIKSNLWSIRQYDGQNRICMQTGPWCDTSSYLNNSLPKYGTSVTLLWLDYLVWLTQKESLYIGTFFDFLGPYLFFRVTIFSIWAKFTERMSNIGFLLGPYI